MRVGTVGMAQRITFAATAAALTLGLVGACGGAERTGGRATADRPAKEAGADGPARRSPQPAVTGAGGAGGRVLSRAELDRAVLAAGDVAEFTVAPADAPPPGGESADRPECAALVAVINGRPEPLAKAAVYRQLIGAENGRPAVFEFLTAHGTQNAAVLFSRLRAAVTACEDGFTGAGGDSTSKYSAVKRLSAPEAGDDTLAYQVTGDFDGDPVPLVFHLLRVGGTVATFYTANLENATTPRIPDALLTAQAAKLS
ncbi:hypothetical protein [Streptomyces sp. AK02-01A]|uniref:hypothetical protein n=1 Tax=Streptomyces sp. AK02-01A TaxID=3028648 RepID=UPI0029A899E4|nr:hypothetical protein [Streptomyces sp. AK02-01A]MDX3851663.1 hypothetical protein [Streptomyces sp. AK02-01A]